ncbi:phage tail protein [Glaciimonas immobilis]|uniref:Uncharacterized protein n=1 Tax=Glaciimonas immobilis TaxID=728004 RepID=A0A840RKD2_9BURK|nr:phage tail protein [Glaciimonas immobilis]KAF3999209.1 oxidoreductase [Glaciimonas immobilis]MBB5198667.1 hypothetical protein [Glaciimonas immobilis]
MMMALGMFVFSLPTLAYQELQRQTEWKHVSNARVGARDAFQYTGKGDDTITLSGWIAPELTGSLYALDALRLMADTGKSWILIQGTGRIYGAYIITSMTEGKTHLGSDGDPARVEFAITLKCTDDDVHNAINNLGNIGTLRDMLNLEGLNNNVNAVNGIGGIVSGLGNR